MFLLTFPADAKVHKKNDIRKYFDYFLLFSDFFSISKIWKYQKKCVPFHSNLSPIPTVKRRSTDSQPTVKAYVTHLFNPYKNHIISYGYAAIYYYI